MINDSRPDKGCLVNNDLLDTLSKRIDEIKASVAESNVALESVKEGQEASADEASKLLDIVKQSILEEFKLHSAEVSAVKNLLEERDALIDNNFQSVETSINSANDSIIELKKDGKKQQETTNQALESLGKSHLSSTESLASGQTDLLQALLSMQKEASLREEQHREEMADLKKELARRDEEHKEALFEIKESVLSSGFNQRQLKQLYVINDNQRKAYEKTAEKSRQATVADILKEQREIAVITAKSRTLAVSFKKLLEDLVTNVAPVVESAVTAADSIEQITNKASETASLFNVSAKLAHETVSANNLQLQKHVLEIKNTHDRHVLSVENKINAHVLEVTSSHDKHVLATKEVFEKKEVALTSQLKESMKEVVEGISKLLTTYKENEKTLYEKRKELASEDSEAVKEALVNSTESNRLISKSIKDTLESLVSNVNDFVNSFGGSDSASLLESNEKIKEVQLEIAIAIDRISSNERDLASSVDTLSECMTKFILNNSDE